MTAALQGVTNVGVLAPADGSVIRSDLTVSVGPARSTDLSPGERSAVPEGISCSSPGTSADGHVVLYSAVRSLATGQRAGVHTLVVLAGSLGAAVSVLVTLPGYTASVGIAVVAWETSAGRPAPHILTLGPGATDSLHTGVGPAARPAVRTPNVASETFTQRSLSAPAALSVGSTGVSLAGVQSTADVGVSDVKRGTLTDGSSAIVLTDGFLTTGTAGAGVEVTVGVGVSGVIGATLADGVTSLGRAVRVNTTGVGRAGLKSALSEGVTNVVSTTLAHSSLSTGTAVGIDTARRLLTRVQVALDKWISFIVRPTLAHSPSSGG